MLPLPVTSEIRKQIRNLIGYVRKGGLIFNRVHVQIPELIDQQAENKPFLLNSRFE